jgi:ankyrin repeat protein
MVLVSGNFQNDVQPPALAESSNEISESNGSAEEFASASDKGTLPENPSASDRSETSTLYDPASQNSKALTTSSRSACADNHSNENDSFPLHTACESGHMNIVKTLLDSGANLTAQGKNDYSPLHYACYKGHTNIVQLLLARGADVNIQNKYRSTPLHLACFKGYTEIVQELLDNSSADINVKNQHGYTPLHVACRHGHTDIVKILEEHIERELKKEIK